MRKFMVAVSTALLASAGASGAIAGGPPPGPLPGPPAPWHGCDEDPHPGDADCPCRVHRPFYTPGTPWNVSAAGGPGIYITSPAVTVPSGRIDIKGPPIYVEAPPIRVEPVQIYIRAPDVRVKPSRVTVEPPQVPFEGCPDGSTDCK
jgi:hypothetical protein